MVIMILQRMQMDNNSEQTDLKEVDLRTEEALLENHTDRPLEQDQPLVQVEKMLHPEVVSNRTEADHTLLLVKDRALNNHSNKHNSQIDHNHLHKEEDFSHEVDTEEHTGEEFLVVHQDNSNLMLMTLTK